MSRSASCCDTPSCNKVRINALNKPQKQLNMEAHLRKFEEEQGR